METSLNELMAQIQDHGASLRVANGHVDLRGNVPPDLLSCLVRRRAELIEYLTYDQETVYELLRAARAYINERYIPGSELDTEALDECIAQAEIDEDMWALRTAVREWVLAWLWAIAETRKTAA